MYSTVSSLWKFLKSVLYLMYCTGTVVKECKVTFRSRFYNQSWACHNFLTLRQLIIKDFLTNSIFTSWIQNLMDQAGWDQARAVITPFFVVVILMLILLF